MKSNTTLPRERSDWILENAPRIEFYWSRNVWVFLIIKKNIYTYDISSIFIALYMSLWLNVERGLISVFGMLLCQVAEESGVWYWKWICGTSEFWTALVMTPLCVLMVFGLTLGISMCLLLCIDCGTWRIVIEKLVKYSCHLYISW